MDDFFNRGLVFIRVQIELHYSLICFYTLMMQAFFRGILRINIKIGQSFNHSFCYIPRLNVLSLSNSRFDHYKQSNTKTNKHNKKNIQKTQLNDVS